MQNKLISVVVPVYNREALIVDTLDSVYQQSYRPLELIVVDDGSIDGTVNVVANWMAVHQNSTGFVTRLVSQENRGGNAARNRGIAESSAQFIAFLDSDDLWFAAKLSRQMQHFADPDVGGVYCGVQNVDLVSGSSTAFQRTYPTGWILPQLLVRDVTAPTSTFVVRKDAFNKVGLFDLSLQARQDWDMWIRLASKYKLQAVPQVLVQYRQHAGPQTAANPYREIKAYRHIRRKYRELLMEQPRDVQRAALASFYKRLGRVYFHHRISTTSAARFYLKALWFQPRDFDAWAAFFGLFIPALFRRQLHLRWNGRFGGTSFAIRSH